MTLRTITEYETHKAINVLLQSKFTHTQSSEELDTLIRNKDIETLQKKYFKRPDIHKYMIVVSYDKRLYSLPLKNYFNLIEGLECSEILYPLISQLKNSYEDELFFEDERDFSTNILPNINWVKIIAIPYRDLVNFKFRVIGYNSFNTRVKFLVRTSATKSHFYTVSYFTLVFVGGPDYYSDKLRLNETIVGKYNKETRQIDFTDFDSKLPKVQRDLVIMNTQLERLNKIESEIAFHFDTDWEIIHIKATDPITFFKNISIDITTRRLRVFLNDFYIVNDIDPSDRLKTRGWNFILGISNISKYKDIIKPTLKIAKNIFSELEVKSHLTHPHIGSFSPSFLSKGTESFCTGGNSNINIPLAELRQYLQTGLPNETMIEHKAVNVLYQLEGYLKMQSLAGGPYYSLQTMRSTAIKNILLNNKVTTSAILTDKYAPVKESYNLFLNILEEFDKHKENIFKLPYCTILGDRILHIHTNSIVEFLVSKNSSFEDLFYLTLTLKINELNGRSAGSALTTQSFLEIINYQHETKKFNMTQIKKLQSVLNLDDSVKYTDQGIGIPLILESGIYINRIYSDNKEVKEMINTSFTSRDFENLLEPVKMQFKIYLNIIYKCQQQNQQIPAVLKK